MKERKRWRYWRSEENAVQEAQYVMGQEGWETLPSQGRLKEKGYHALATAIQRYHGGYSKFRETLGVEQMRLPNGLLSNFEYILDQAKTAMEAESWNLLPGAPTLKKNGYDALAQAIMKYHGGFKRVRDALGQETVHGRWVDEEYTLDQARNILKMNNWNELPSSVLLRKKGYRRLLSAIERNHGGVNQFRDRLKGKMNPPTEREDLEDLLDTYVDGGEED